MNWKVVLKYFYNMLKCAPYIKNLCSSLQSGLWKEASANPNSAPSSLPGSPIRRSRNGRSQQDTNLPSPTRSEGGAPEELRQANSKNPRSSGVGLEAVSMPVLVVARTTDKEGEVITTAVKSTCSDLMLKNSRPESPDVTRPAKKLELNNSLGAISKVRLTMQQRKNYFVESPTASTTSSNSSSSPKYVINLLI